MANGMERREFLKVVGVAGAGAAMASCSSKGPERLLPYVIPEKDIVPGMATYYRTTCRECPAGCGMDIKTREGRAIKAEGNPLSPISHGRLCARGQASLQGLYNPDRVPQALARSGDSYQKITWDDAEQRLAAALQQNRGRTVFLTESYPGTLDRLIDDFCAAVGAQRVIYDTFDYQPIRAANRALFGVDGVPVHDFSQADVVVSFGADFMETWLSPVDYAHGFVQATAYGDGKVGHFIAVTPHQSLTDMNADEWIPARPGTEHLVALAMAKLVAEKTGSAGAAAGLLGSVDVDQAARAAGVPAEKIRLAAAAFGNGGRSLAVGPGVSSAHASATALAAAVGVLNTVAGNVGKTVRFSEREEHAARGVAYRDVQQLFTRMKAGEVGALLVYGPNPLYTLPPSDDVAAALDRVPFVASFASYRDETTARAHLLLPDHHFLESWGDYVPRTGVRSLIQPVMMPVFDTKQTGDVLLSVAKRAGVSLPTAATTFYDYLRERWGTDVHPGAGGAAPFEGWWRETLQQGVVVTTRPAGGAGASLSGAGLAGIKFEVPSFPAAKGGDEFQLITYPSYKYYDGRLANRPWLQELPDPVSKMGWTSWVEVNPEAARRLGLDEGSLAEVETAQGKVRLPTFVHPGMRPDVIAIQLGQGHHDLGRWAEGRGVNAAGLLGAVAEPASGALVYTQTRATLRATGEWARFPHQGNVLTESGRHIYDTVSLAEANAAAGAPAGAVAAGGERGEAGETNPKDKVVTELQKTGGFAPEPVEAGPAGYPPPSVYYGEYTETQPRWGMAIDMDRCIGCSACVTACYAENNIGIVGPELMANGRILHWIRIERYYPQAETTAAAGATFLPMLCQQCGNAPCEPVCPVYASYHTPEGLNAQVYNRCVGTRYCANNCPYKVRYFNWFSWEWPEPLNWQLNPDVTVREKGVMEKCTFCVQRIRDAQNQARLEDRGPHDGEIVPACAQTCPGEAIVFGNVKDPNSRVAQVSASGRGYRVLEDLNTQSAITYLKKVVESSEA